MSHFASVNLVVIAALFLFQSHGGGAHPILLSAEGSDSGGGGEGGRGHAGGPRAATQEKRRGSEPLRWTT